MQSALTELPKPEESFGAAAFNGLIHHLFENILFPHQLLSLPVGFVHHDLQNILSVVGNIHHKEHQILQELGNSPENTHKTITHLSFL